MPSARTRSISGASPLGWASGETHQSPSPARVVAAPAEPTVVEHEALDADRRGTLGEAAERVEVVVEVHRLPRVQHDRPRPVAVGRRRAHDGVELPARRAEPGRRVDGVHRRRRVALAGRSTTSPGCSSSPSWTIARPSGSRAACDPRVAAPRQVGAPHLAALLAEAGGAGPQQRRALVRRAAAAVLGEERPVVERPPARMELPAPPPVERHQLGDVRRQRPG